jgi:hypothetical protein
MNRYHIPVLIAVLLVLISCKGNGDEPKEPAIVQETPESVPDMQEEAGRIIEEQMTKMKKKEASMFPCSVFTQQELESLLGNPLDSGSYAFEHRSEDDRQWRSESCGWSGKGEEANEVSLWVSLPKHFDGGKVICYPPPGAGANNPYAPREISGLGDQAWWEYQKSWGIGTLRVCSDKALVEVKVDLAGNDEALAERVARSMAGKIISSQ